MSKIQVAVPDYAEGAKTIKLRQWLASEGDAVKKGEEIAEATTDKIAIYIESPANGVISRLLVEDGETVQVGQVIAEIDVED